MSLLPRPEACRCAAGLHRERRLTASLGSATLRSTLKSSRYSQPWRSFCHTGRQGCSFPISRNSADAVITGSACLMLGLVQARAA